MWQSIGHHTKKLVLGFAARFNSNQLVAIMAISPNRKKHKRTDHTTSQIKFILTVLLEGLITLSFLATKLLSSVNNL